MTARIPVALALALFLSCPALPAPAAETAPLVLAQAANAEQAQPSPGGWSLRRKVKSPDEVDANLPPAQQQVAIPAANATAPLSLPEPPLPRESAKSLPGKPLAPAKDAPQQTTPPSPAPAQPAPPPPPAAPAPAAKAQSAPSAPVQPPAPAPKPQTSVPAGPPSTKNMVAPPKIVPAPEADKPSPLVAAPKQPVLHKGAISVGQRRTADELQVSINAGGAVDFETFFLQNPPRMIVDITGDWAIRGPHELAVNSHGCRTVRLGRHEDKLRVVFDLDPGSVYRSETRRTDKGLRVLFAK